MQSDSQNSLSFPQSPSDTARTETPENLLPDQNPAYLRTDYATNESLQLFVQQTLNGTAFSLDKSYQDHYDQEVSNNTIVSREEFSNSFIYKKSVLEQFEEPNMEENQTGIYIDPTEVDYMVGDTLFSLLQMNSNLLNNLLNSASTAKKSIMELTNDVNFFTTQGEVKNLKVKEKALDAQLDGFLKVENPSWSLLSSHLTNSTKKNYQYEIILTHEQPKLAKRKKGIVLKVELIDTFSKTKVDNVNKINLKARLYTWQIPSNRIEVNTNGNPALAGKTETVLFGGQAIFSCLQIHEVTSRFVNKVAAIALFPEKYQNSDTSLSLNQNETNVIDPGLVKPLVLDKIIVKSLKKKYFDKLIKLQE